MSAHKHTPGPWTADPDNLRIIGSDGYSIFAFRRPFAEHRANACLGSAAPDLLNALSVLADVAEARGIPCDAARAAIAKATGGQA